MIEVYRGSSNTWETDEMGHMNVRFYISKMMEGLAEISHVIGLPQAFRSDASSTLRPRDQHIRFLREAHAGRPLVMFAGVLEIGESSALVYQRLDHVGGGPSAVFRTWVDHVDASTGQAFPWPPAVRAALQRLLCEPDASIGPRSIDVSKPPRPEALMAHADAVGSPVIGRAIVQPQHLDALGFMTPEFFIGRISDSVSNLLAPWREKIAQAAQAEDGPRPRTGGAVLEYRIVYRRWPRAGDRLVIRSALGDVRDRFHTLIHWVLDPDTGLAWCTCEVVAITLNLDTRKIMPAPAGHGEMLRAIAPQGLTA
jgi:acyl-CoA thioester hydrolase